MKNSKAEVQKKAEKKAAKKELEKSLTAKFFEAVKNLGHDAEQIGEDLVLVSKFVAKKIGKKLGSTKKKVEENATDGVPAIAKKAASAKREVKKDIQKTKQAIKKVTAKAKPVISSVKVEAIATAEKAAKLITKPVASTTAKVTKATKTAPAVKKMPARKPKASPETPES
ncbi:hypothetical protein [Pedobacter duraquae]|uniref:Histone H1/5 n=1 Tax=Pedobacter duraquae TaxID=425511 RepID=A0A4R6IPV9_9SPHI|nr:hypothetical protein [Pedobacter duraquae]TDO24342.1 hypothetical protein CLV32_0631 [Pedobacter duraquae]